jgi:hypothetical protein
MTDPLAYIEAAHKRAEQTAQAAGGDGTPVWSTGRHHAVRDENGDAVAYDEGRPTPAQAAHIAANDPAAVLRRIAADRKTLAACEEILAVDGWEYDDTPNLADATICNMAEGWGWSEETT